MKKCRRELPFDNELYILKDIRHIDRNDCCIIADSDHSDSFFAAKKIIDDIFCDETFANWKHNTNTQFPPDLINEKDGLMMEVMRVDDRSFESGSNPRLSREREIMKEISYILDNYPEDTEVFINADPHLPLEKDHSYLNYYHSFKRTVEKHLLKIQTYKTNFPNKKLIFLIADETEGMYYEANQPMVLHCPFLDRRFLDVFIESDLDYFLWYIPYNTQRKENGITIMPHLIIIDVKNARNGKMLHKIDYLAPLMAHMN